MKQSLQRLCILRAAPLAIAAVAAFWMLLSVPSVSFASTTSVLYSEDFSNGDFPPDGWIDDSYYGPGSIYYGSGLSGWYYSSNGKGDYNGSVVSDEWNYSNGLFGTPQIDLTAYEYPGDQVYVDFDLFFERDLYQDGSYAADHIVLHFISGKNDTSVVDVNNLNEQTYNYDEGDYHVDPVTDEGAWRHYHVPVPLGFRSSDFEATWESKPGQGLSNPALDNVSITATHYNLLGVSPKSLNFGQYALGDTSEIKCVYLSNPNPVAINTSNFTIDNNAEFEILHSPSSLPAGTLDSPSLDSICVRFFPINGGNQTGTLSFTNDGDAPNTIGIGLAGFGLAPILSDNATVLFLKTKTRLGDTLTQSFLVGNTGIGNLVISPSSYIQGEDAGQYFISHLPGPIAAGMSDTVSVSYAPTIEGGHPAELHLLSNGGAAPVVLLRGTGILPRLVITPTSFNFDSVAVYTEQCQQFTLTNPGSDTLVVTKDFLSSRDYDFTYTGLTTKDGNNRIAPDQSRTVTVCFTPLQNGTRFATLRFETNIPKTFESPSQDTGSFTVQLTGIGVPYGRLALSGMTADSVIIGNTLCQTDTIRNTGQSDMVITSAALAGADSDEFAFSGVTLPLTIAPGGMQTFDFCVTPAQRGVRTSTLNVSTFSAGETQSLTIPVFAYGLEVCASASAQTLFETAKPLVGSTDTESVTVTNCGDVATSYTAAITAGQTLYSISGSATSSVIAPGSTTTFAVVFTPTSTVASSGTLTITGGTGVTPMLVTLSGTGGGVTVQATGEPGAVMVGECTTFDVIVTNNGNVDWTPNTATLGGANAGDFSIISGPTPTTIAPGATATVTIKFCPTTTNAEVASLSFPDASPSTSSFSYALTGTGAASGVSQSTEVAGITLNQSYPNPMSGHAQISFVLPSASAVRLDIVDAKGNLVKEVMNTRLSEGVHTADVDAHDLASGTYFYILTSGDVRLSRTMTVVK